MKLKLISDGTPWGTSVVNAETGETVENVTRVQLDVSRERIVVDMTLVNVETGVEFRIHSEESMRVRRPVQP